MSASAGFERALELKRSGRLDEAVIALEDVLSRREPPDALALAHLADVQLRRRRLTEAAEVLDRAESAAGTTAFTARVRGDLCYREGRWRDAARCYLDADVLGDRGTWSLAQMARCHVRLGELEAARGAAARVIERDEGAAPAWVVLGEVARREGRPNDAVELFERAHRADPGDQFAYAKLVESRLERVPAAERAREVEVLVGAGGGENRHLLGVLARLHSEGGNPEAAADVWRARTERHGDLWSRKMEGYALRRAGQGERAAAVLRACLLEDPQDKILLRTYVHLQRARGALDELRETLEAMVPVAGSRRGAVYGELRKLGPPPG